MSHCSYCLKQKEKHLLCGKCKKRRYCSKECQIEDWNGKGQKHKNWCGKDCGEEDKDWEVVSIEGKGLGVVAKRFFPSKSIIMVDCHRDYDDPRIEDLYPENASIEEKIRKNILSSGDGFKPVICTRISR